MKPMSLENVVYECNVNGAVSRPRLIQFLICSHSAGLHCDEAVGNRSRQYACHHDRNKAKSSQLHCSQPVYLLTTAFTRLPVSVTCDNTICRMVTYCMQLSKQHPTCVLTWTHKRLTCTGLHSNCL